MKQPSHSYSWFLAAGLVVVGLALRLPLLNGSFWLDEAAQALESARPLSEQLQIAYDFQPPLLHLIVHFSLYFSREEWWLRTIGAVIPGLITIWATYQIGQKLTNQRVAFWATLLLATSSFHIFYSQELRPYSLPAMFACLSWLVLLNWPKPNLKLPFSKRYAVFSTYTGYTVLTLLGLYSSYLYPFLVLGQLFYIVSKKRELLSTYIVHAVIWTAGFLPWLPSLFEQLSVSGELRNQLPSWEKVVSIEAARSVALVFGKFMFGVLDLDLSFYFAAGAMLFLLILSYGVASYLLPKNTLEAFFQKIKAAVQHKKLLDISTQLIWFAVPLITAWLVSLVVPILHPKRVLFLLPAFYLLLVTSLENFPHQKVKNVVLGMLILINIFGTLEYYYQPRLQRENWRDLHKIIVEMYPDKSVTLFSFPEPFAPWLWYDQQSHPTEATGTLAIKDAHLNQTMEHINAFTYVLVFDYLRTLTDPDNQLLASLKSEGFKEMDFFDQTNIGFVRIYARPQDSLSIN